MAPSVPVKLRAGHSQSYLIRRRSHTALLKDALQGVHLGLERRPLF